MKKREKQQLEVSKEKKINETFKAVEITLINEELLIFYGNLFKESIIHYLTSPLGLTVAANQSKCFDSHDPEVQL